MNTRDKFRNRWIIEFPETGFCSRLNDVPEWFSGITKLKSADVLRSCFDPRRFWTIAITTLFIRTPDQSSEKQEATYSEKTDVLSLMAKGIGQIRTCFEELRERPLRVSGSHNTADNSTGCYTG